MHTTPVNKGFGWQWRSNSICSLSIVAALLAVRLFSAEACANAVDRAPTEYEVKAAYVFYFAKFVSWPEDAFRDKNSPLTIGVFGNDEFGSLLETIVKGKTIQEHPISIRFLKKPADFRSCHLLFISASEVKRMKQIAEDLGVLPILTITEADTGSQAKGVMNLFLEEGKVQFEVDTNGAARARLQISSKLMLLARGNKAGRPGRGE
jgi:hypothetical protein